MPSISLTVSGDTATKIAEAFGWPDSAQQGESKEEFVKRRIIGLVKHYVRQTDRQIAVSNMEQTIDQTLEEVVIT